MWHIHNARLFHDAYNFILTSFKSSFRDSESESRHKKTSESEQGFETVPL